MIWINTDFTTILKSWFPVRFLHDFSQSWLANLPPCSMWQAVSPSCLQVGFTSILVHILWYMYTVYMYLYSYRFIYCDWALQKGAWSSPWRIFLPLELVCWEPDRDRWAAWQREKLVMSTGNFSMWHFIAGNISLTWFSQIANTSELPHHMVILCLTVSQRRRCGLTIPPTHRCSPACPGGVPVSSPLLSSKPTQRACLQEAFPQTSCSFVLSCFAGRQWPIT